MSKTLARWDAVDETYPWMRHPIAAEEIERRLEADPEIMWRILDDMGRIVAGKKLAHHNWKKTHG